MILGLGVDILSLARFEAVTRRRGIERVAKRVCCSRELAEFGRLSRRNTPASPSSQLGISGKAIENAAYGEGQAVLDPQGQSTEEDALMRKQLRFLSSRWAIKEAAYKALTPSLPLLRNIQPAFHLSFHSFDLVHMRGIPSLRLLRLLRHTAVSDPRADRAEGIMYGHEGPVIETKPRSGLHSGARGEGTDEPNDGDGYAAVMDGISLLSTLSHDAGVVVGVVIAQKTG